MLCPVTDIPARRHPVGCGLPALARSLEVSLAYLTTWVDGVAKAPMPVYIRALEMVARSRPSRI